MDRCIPLVISEGNPFTRGQHLGSSQAGRVRHAAAAYMEIFKQFAGLSRDNVFAAVEDFLPTISDYAPHLLEEMRGMASSILSDHATSPDSICLHNQSTLPFEMQGESIASIIFDLTAGTLDIADGPPCQHNYRSLNLTDYFSTYA